MKLRFNYLPEEYRPLKRSWKLIFGFVFLLIFSIGYSFFIKNYFLKKAAAIKEVEKSKLNELDNQIQMLKAGIKSLKNKLKFSLLDRKKIKELNQQIAFFNLIFERGFSWFEFFILLEKTVPKGVWIKAVEFKPLKKGGLEAKLKCEALDSHYAPQFLANLQKYKQVIDPFLSTVKTDEQTYGSVFDISFKYIPFKRLDLDPDIKDVTVGEKIVYKVKAINFEDDEIYNFPDQISWEVKGNSIKLIAPGIVQAVATGESFVIATTNWGRVFGEAVVRVFTKEELEKKKKEFEEKIKKKKIFGRRRVIKKGKKR